MVREQISDRRWQEFLVFAFCSPADFPPRVRYIINRSCIFALLPYSLPQYICKTREQDLYELCRPQRHPHRRYAQLLPLPTCLYLRNHATFTPSGWSDVARGRQRRRIDWWRPRTRRLRRRNVHVRYPLQRSLLSRPVHFHSWTLDRGTWA